MTETLYLLVVGKIWLHFIGEFAVIDFLDQLSYKVFIDSKHFTTIHHN